MFLLGLASGVSGDRLHGLSALRLALLSCSRDVTQWCPWFWHGLRPGTFGVLRSCQWCSLCSPWASLQGFLETDDMASLHFGSLCCRARGMSLNGHLRSDEHLWRLSKVWPVPVGFLRQTTWPFLHFGSLCCRGYLRRDQHAWRLSECLSAIVSVVLARLTSWHFWSLKILSVV